MNMEEILLHFCEKINVDKDFLHANPSEYYLLEAEEIDGNSLESLPLYAYRFGTSQIILYGWAMIDLLNDIGYNGNDGLYVYKKKY